MYINFIAHFISPVMLQSSQQKETSLAQRESVLRVTALEPFQQALERVIGDNDILPLNYLALGEKAAKSVVRVIVPQPNGKTFFGTGFMVSPRLMMTNYHVFDEEPAQSGFALHDLAAKAMIEFDYTLDENGIPMDSTRFRLRPDEFLASSLPDALDYALVAVDPTATDDPHRSLPEFGYLKLVSLTGKAAPDEKLTTIHHPKGEYKSISIRDKRLTKFVDDHFIEYEVDTEPGSSGAPIFNDQWLVVALHHQGVPEMIGSKVINRDGSVRQPGQSDDLINWIANKGIRISAIVNDLAGTFPSNTPLLEPIFTTDTLRNMPPQPEVPDNTSFPLTPDPIMSTNGYATPMEVANLTKTHSNGQMPSASMPTVQFTVPLEISIRVGHVVPAGAAPAVLDGPLIESYETLRPSPGSYIDRNGYDPSFLVKAKLPFDKLLEPVKNKLAPTLDGKALLHYRNFSVAINRARRMTVATAVNIDGKRSQSMGRSDIWILDPRMKEQFQTGPEVYADNDLDRGHMVRRLDPVWGNQSTQANNDTFHYTNSCPQHKDLNQKTWASLEDYILDNTKLEKLKVTVFTGPVFSEADIPYRGVLLPLQFWKVAAVIKKDGKLSVTGYMLSQKDLLTQLTESIPDDGFGQFRTYQVPLTLLQSLTKLDFSPYFVSDPLHRAEAVQFEAATDLHEIKADTDLLL